MSTWHPEIARARIMLAFHNAIVDNLESATYASRNLTGHLSGLKYIYSLNRNDAAFERSRYMVSMFGMGPIDSKWKNPTDWQI